MSSQKILVICGAGMTSSILVSRMREAVAANPEWDYKIGSCASNQMEQYAPQTDILFLAPHLSFLQEELAKRYPEKKLVVLPAEVYSRLDGAEVLRLLEVKEEEKETTGVKIKRWLVAAVSRRIIRAITAASYNVMAVLVIGGLFTLVQNLPYEPLAEMIRGTAIERMAVLGSAFTINSVSVYMAFLVGYHYGREMQLSPPHVGINSLICFFLILNVHGNMADMTYFGSKGLFCAFITAFLSVKIFMLMHHMSERFMAGLSRLPKQIYQSFFSLIPTFVCVSLFTAMTAVFALTPYGSFPEFVYQTLQQSVSAYLGDSIWGLMCAYILVHILWFFGIHGGNIVRIGPVLMPAGLENVQAFQQGLPLPHIIHHQFVSVCIFGGAGSTLPLALLMYTRAKSEHMKQLGRISLPMGIFFINEPIILGLPIMMNPLMLGPFLAVPLVSILLTYLVMKAGIVPIAVGFDLPWTTPIFITGIVQGGWRLAVWQAVLFVLQTVMWYPFFRMMDQKYVMEESVRNDAAAGGRRV